ncbi:MAG: two pore domain potassium channel family protein [Eubacterium sp.]|nr:two pore domain potassium channel family protein [Eubacterium sp.]
MKKLRILGMILKQTRTDRILTGYVVFVLLAALAIWITEPGIHTYLDSLWYCYAVFSTAGFGDVVVTTLLPKIVSVVITLYSTLVVALITGVVVNFYTEIMKRKNAESIETFFDKIEQLPELSKDELEILSEKVKEFRAGKLN